MQWLVLVLVCTASGAAPAGGSPQQEAVVAAVKAGVEAAGNCMQAVQRLEAAGRGSCQQGAVGAAVVVAVAWVAGVEATGGWKLASQKLEAAGRSRH